MSYLNDKVILVKCLDWPGQSHILVPQIVEFGALNTPVYTLIYNQFYPCHNRPSAYEKETLAGSIVEAFPYLKDSEGKGYVSFIPVYFTNIVCTFLNTAELLYFLCDMFIIIQHA